MPVPIFLIDEDRLFRLAVARLLDSRFEVVGGANSLAAGQARVSEMDPRLVLLDWTRPSGAEANLLRILRRTLPDARIAFLTSDLSPLRLSLALSLNLDGLLSKGLSSAGFIAALTLILEGEKVWPTGLAATIVTGRAASIAECRPQDGFTGREAQVLRHIVIGDSNKAIAKSLQITEATVKVHLKTVLRKISAENRSQAAIWALQHGYAVAN